MKRLIIFLLLFAAIKVAGQTTGYLRFDTVKIMKQNGTCELYIQNKTKDSTGGILTNIGNGLTSFVPTRQVVDTIFVGGDTVIISHKLDSIHVYSGSSPNPDTIYQYKGGDSTIAGYIPKPANNNTNVGSAFRWLNEGTQVIKTVASSNTILWDSTSTANSLTPKADTSVLATQHDLTLLGGTIQQVLAIGDTALRKIIFKDTASAASTHNFTIETLRPTDYNTAYTFGRQALYHRGISYTTGVNASGRPNVVNSILSYNQNAGSGGRILTDEASYGFRAETHFETGGSRIFEFFLPEIELQDGLLYRPNAWYIAKDARSAIWNGQLSAFNGLYLAPSGSAFDSVMFSHTAAGHTFQTFGNGSFIFRNARNALNSFSVALTDNGPNIMASSSSATTVTLNQPFFISHTSNQATLTLSPPTTATQPVISSSWGTVAGSRSVVNMTGSSPSFVSIAYANTNTGSGAYVSHQLQTGSGTAEYATFHNINNWWNLKMYGRAADDSSFRIQYNGTDRFFFKKAGQLGIGITPGAFKLNVEGSVRINKDSVSLQAANGTRHMLVIDTATGRLQRMAIPSGGGGITSINSETGPAISIAAGTGISVNNTTNTVTVSTNTSYLTSGTYTPTLTNTSNVAASVASVSQYMRIGNIIHVSGMVQIDATAAATVTELGISLPVSSDFVEEFECAGTTTATYSGANESGNIRADVTNNRALIRFYSTSTDNQAWFFTFTYLVAGGS